MRHGRQDEFKRLSLRLQPLQRVAENRHVMSDLAAAASRQNHQHRRRPIAAPLLLRPRPERAELLDQGMANIRTERPMQAAVRLRLKRQQRQDMIDIGPHGARPARPPRPNRWRDVVNDRDRRIAGPHPAGDPMGKVRAIDDDENVGLCAQHSGGGLPDQTQHFWKLFDDGRKADDRQLLDRKERFQPLARHRKTADALEPDGVAEPLTEHLHQMCPQPVAGFFCCDQKNLARDAAVCRARHQEGKPVTKSPAVSAASIMACGSATTVLPAMTARPARPAAAAPLTVCDPTVGKSKRKSCPLLGAFTKTPRPAGARMRLPARKLAIRFNNSSVPSIPSTPTTWPSMTTAA